MGHSLHLRSLILMALVAIAVGAQSVDVLAQSTGLKLTPSDQLRGVPLASSPYSGAELPSSVDLSDRIPTPGQQGHQQSCVAWAVAYALKSYQETVELGWNANTPDHQFSPAYIYNQINNGVDGGSNFSDALNILSSQGASTEDYFPYNESDFTTKPSQSARDEAKRYRIDTWRQVNPSDTREVQAQLNAGFPVLIGVVVDDGFRQLGQGQIWQSVVGSQHGGHALLVVGYNDARSAFKFINSWGTDWSDHGYGWISYDFFRQIVHEAYVAKDAVDTDGPSPVAPVVPGPKPPTDPVSASASFSIQNIAYNVLFAGNYGMVFSGNIQIPNSVSGSAQIVIRVVKVDQAGHQTPVGGFIPYALPDGRAATGTPPLSLQGMGVQTTWTAFLPYAALMVPHGMVMTPYGPQGYAVQTNLQALPTLYINQFGVKDGAPIPFFVSL